MSVSISLNNPRAFKREWMVLMGGGALSGIVVTALAVLAGTASPILSVLSFGAIIGLLANLSDVKSGTPVLRLVLCILGGVAWGLLSPIHWALAAAVGGATIGAAFVLDKDDSLLERVFFAGIYAIMLCIGVWVTTMFAPQFETPLIANTVFGGIWGLFLSIAAGLKRADWSRDELLAEFADAYSELKGQHRETIRNGRVLYEQILQELKTAEAGMTERGESIARETGHALIALTKRSQSLADAAHKTGQRSLEGRIVELDERIKAATDKTVANELSATLNELVEQMKSRRRFDVAQARLEARQQRCFTALERLHVSLVQAASGADDSGVQASIENLEKLSDEIHWRNLSVDELVGDLPETTTDDTEEIVASLRDEMESEASLRDETVLDLNATPDDSGPSGADGTDGTVTVEEVAEEVTQART